MRDRRTRWLLAIACAFFAPSSLQGQAGLGHLEDATVVPRGLFRLRAIAAWSRYDTRFTATGEEPLGAPLTSPALGRAQISALGTIDSLASLAAAQPFTLSLGQSRLDARGREEIIPIGVEYGLTNRVTVGVIVPIVRKRVSTQWRLDSLGATVGPNLHRTLPAAASMNQLVQTQFTNAIGQLQTRLTQCQGNPSGAGCAALLARQAEAQALIASSQGFASSVGALYGTSSEVGQAFVPRSGTSAQTEIALRVGDFNTRYRDLLGSSTDLLTAIPVAAPGPPGTAQVQSYLTNELGGDSIVTEERSGFGDVEVGVRMLVIDRPASDTRSFGARMTASAAYRFSSSSQQSPSEIVDLRLGDSRNMVASNIAVDLAAGRVGVLASADVAIALGDASSSPPAIVAPPFPLDSRWVGVHVAPRFHLSRPFSVHGAYTLRTMDASGSEQLVGGGVSFSTLPQFTAGGPFPMEMRYTHLQSLSGPSGLPKYFRDQLEVRLYFGRR